MSDYTILEVSFIIDQQVTNGTGASVGTYTKTSDLYCTTRYRYNETESFVRVKVQTLITDIFVIEEGREVIVSQTMTNPIITDEEKYRDFIDRNIRPQIEEDITSVGFRDAEEIRLLEVENTVTYLANTVEL